MLYKLNQQIRKFPICENWGVKWVWWNIRQKNRISYSQNFFLFKEVLEFILGLLGDRLIRVLLYEVSLFSGLLIDLFCSLLIGVW